MPLNRTNTSPGYLLGRLFSFTEFIDTSFGRTVKQTPLAMLARLHNEPTERWVETALKSFLELQQEQRGELSAELTRESEELTTLCAAHLDGPLTAEDLLLVLSGYFEEKESLAPLIPKIIDVPGYRGPERRTRKPAEEPLEQWFDQKKFLREVRQHVNVMYGNRWNAFSMPDGLVYVQTALVFDIIRTMGKKRRHSDIGNAIMDDQLRETVLYRAFVLLADNESTVATELIADGEFCAHFDLTMADGTIFKRCSYVPFKAAAFGCSVDELERCKYGRIRNIASVRPS